MFSLRNKKKISHVLFTKSYQDDVWMIKAVCNGPPFTVEKISPRLRIELGPLDQ